MNFDKTFCASPNCMGDCGRQLSDEQKKYLDQTPINCLPTISFAYFCGYPGWYKPIENKKALDE